jgi:hypothetical protein
VLMSKAGVIQRVYDGISLGWQRGGWRRRAGGARVSASPRWRGGWECTGNRLTAGRASLNHPGCAGYARRATRPSSEAQPCPIA